MVATGETIETQRARYARLSSIKGEFERVLPTAKRVIPPAIWIDGDKLLWSSLPASYPGSTVPPGSQTSAPAGQPTARFSARTSTYGVHFVDAPVVTSTPLELIDFARIGQDVGDWLDNGDPPEEGFARRVLEYARHWGVLELCERNLPIGHPSDQNLLNRAALPDTLQLHLDFWRRWAGSPIQDLVYMLEGQLEQEYLAARSREGEQRFTAGNGEGIGPAHSATDARGHIQHEGSDGPPEDEQGWYQPGPLFLNESFSTVREAIDTYINPQIVHVFGWRAAIRVKESLSAVLERNPRDATIGDILHGLRHELEQWEDWRLPAEAASHACTPVPAVKISSSDKAYTFSDSLAAWAFYARRAHRILLILCAIMVLEEAIQEGRDEAGARQELGRLWCDLEGERVWDFQDSDGPELHRGLLVDYADVWMQLASPRPVFDTAEASELRAQHGGPGITLSSGLFGSLGFQMRTLIAGVEGLSHCRNCGLFFITPLSQSRRGRLCPRCKDEDPANQERKQRARRGQRQRAAQAAASLGLLLGSEESAWAETVRRLILSDRLWAEVAPILASPVLSSRPGRGRPGTGDREALTGILFLLGSKSLLGRGLTWLELPQELGCGSGETCRRRRDRWHKAGVWARIRAVLEPRLAAIGEFEWDKAEAYGRHPAKAPRSGDVTED